MREIRGFSVYFFCPQPRWAPPPSALSTVWTSWAPSAPSSAASGCTWTPPTPAQPSFARSLGDLNKRLLAAYVYMTLFPCPDLVPAAAASCSCTHTFQYFCERPCFNFMAFLACCKFYWQFHQSRIHTFPYSSSSWLDSAYEKLIFVHPHIRKNWSECRRTSLPIVMETINVRRSKVRESIAVVSTSSILFVIPDLIVCT